MKTLGLLLLLLVAGCATPDKEMKALLGHHSRELIAGWGPPHQKTMDGEGGEIWTYTMQRQWSTPGNSWTTYQDTGTTTGTITPSLGGVYNVQANTSSQGNAMTFYHPPRSGSYVARRSFFVNSAGIIYQYAWQGK